MRNPRLNQPVARASRTCQALLAKAKEAVAIAVRARSVSDPRGAFSWMDLACPVAVVGLWIAAFCGQLKSRPLFPVYDPLWTEVEKLHGR